VNPDKLVAPSVVLTGRWGCHNVLQPVPHPLIPTTVAEEFWCEVFTGRMPFLSPNQQCQSTEVKVCVYCADNENRVKLSKLDNDPLSTYVNASFIRVGAYKLLNCAQCTFCVAWWCNG